MNNFRYLMLFFMASALMLASGCAGGLGQNKAMERAKMAFETARTTPGVEANAPVALYEAKAALDKASKSSGDTVERDHLAYLAEKKAELAVLLAEQKASENSITELGVKKNNILMMTKDRESAAARAEAEKRTREAEQKAREAELAVKRSEEMMKAAEKARLEAEAALAQKKELEKELADMQAEMTDRGAVITLGNILFEVNKSRLLQGGLQVVDKIAAFLKKYPKRELLIEGHTDSRGSDSYNLTLSRERANSVFTALLDRGIDSERITTKGYGEAYPVAGNDTEAGRQQNRRVEVVILDEGVKAEQKFRQ